MNFRIVLALIVVGFVAFCGWLVLESGVCDTCGSEGGPCILLQQTTATEGQQGTKAAEEMKETLAAADPVNLGADHAPATNVMLGATDPNTEDHETGFKFQSELSSKGAAIRKVTFSNGLHNGRPSGFNDRDPNEPKPLEILSPVKLNNGSEVLSMANTNFVFVNQKLQLPLDKLHWKSLGVKREIDGSETVAFETVITVKDTGEPIVKLTKTYKITLDSYLMDCNFTIENLTDNEQQVRFDLNGPVGLGREAVRSDMRNVVGGFLTTDGQVVASRKDLLVGFPMNLFTKNVGLKDTTSKYQEALQLRDQAKIDLAKKDLQIGRNLPESQKSAAFLWAAATNKYFAAIVRPVPDEGRDYCDWIKDKTAQYYNPDGDEKGDTGDETIGLKLKIGSGTRPLVIQANSAKTYNFQLYLGPKDKSLFDKNKLYKRLGFANTITFMPCCCCPTCLIYPIAFAILALMKWMYGFIGNYGIVIIILVFLFRLAMHPITKKSQVSMSKMSKLAPKAEEIKKKYANNKAEMNKQMMALYKEQGASPFIGFLPMFVQMPIWIALWSAVYASIDLRGAGFLPFWITDLSMPDALVRFSTITVPLLGWKIDSLNLLPILMGLAFYLQQKLMPSQAAAASANPQVAQQQKIMMIMMPLFLPLVLYKAPSGVNLYIMSSTFAGVFEQYFIRKHIREKEEAESKGLVAVTSKTGGKVKKKKPKPFYKM
jgi:YidC/Oxa1 family membrane protein insertase